MNLSACGSSPRLHRRLLACTVFALAASLGATAATAQSTLATIVGSVTDPSAGVVPGATVTIVNVNTQASRVLVTDPTGGYVAANLDPGSYVITVALAGFADAARQVDLLARQNVRVDVAMSLAGAAESVEVRASNPVIETERATIDNSKSGEEINRLALNFRATNNTSPIVVATLAQGVQQDRQGSISIAGNLPFQTSFSIDGISSQRTRAGGASRDMFPSVESMEEFKVSSANNNAEFMQVADVTTTTKSGSNTFHGSAFWFFQDSGLNSVDQFAPKDANGDPIKPDVQANSFGGSLGGPIFRNKTFFFGAYEGVRRPNETTLSQIVPPDAFRRGDLSSINRQLVNPLTGQPFPNNQIPINPVSARALESFFERQNQATGAAIGAPNYLVNVPGDFAVNGFDARLDHSLTAAQKVFGRYTFKNVDNIGPTASWNTKQGERTVGTEIRQFAGTHNWVLSNSWLNELRGGYNTTSDLEDYSNSGQGADLVSALGLVGLPSAPTSGGFPSFEFADGSFIPSGGNKPRNIFSKVVQFNDNLTYVRANHTVKAGADVQYVEYKDQITFFAGEEFGRYQFTGVYSGNAFADFLLGLPQFTGYSINTPDANPYATHFAGYVQDDWKPTDSLTINLGLRYDFRGPMQDRSNQMGNFDREFPGGRVIVANPGVLDKIPSLVRNSVPNTTFVTADEAGLPESLRFADKNNFNPRLSIAYRPWSDGKTVFRGGFGLYTVPLYGAVNYSMVATVTAVAAAFSNATPAPSFVFPNMSSASSAQGALPPGSLDFRRANQMDLEDPRVAQWTVTIDRDLGWNTGLRVSYVGSKTEDLVVSPDLNQVPSNTLGYTAVRDTRPFRDWNVVTTRDNGAEARYDALGVELTRRFSRGVAFNASYTLAKNVADHGGPAPSATSYTAENGANITDLFRGDADRGNEPFTRRHRFVSTFYAELPFGRGRAHGTDMSRALDALVGGWDVTGIALLQSGLFLTPFFTNADPSGTGTTVRGFNATQRPDCVGDGLLADPTAAAWFDAADFVRPANNIGRFGNCEVGFLEGPGTQTFSLTLGKYLAVGGTSRLRFEASFSNLFDIENLDVPGTMNITSSAFGRITSTQTVDQAGPRTIQFSLRYTF